MRAGLLSILLGMPGACALDAGEPYGDLDARLDAHWDARPDRDAGDGWQKLDNDFEIMVEELTVTASDIELVDVGSGQLAFDPANPPPGYSLCHNGHCHDEDGRLVSYEEISQELTGGGGVQALAHLPVGEVELVAGAELNLDCAPSCDLPRGHIGLASLEILSVSASGIVRDSRADPRLAGERDWSLAVDFAGAPLTLFDREIDIPLDRSEDPHVELTFSLSLSAALWDGLVWHELAEPSGTIDLAGDVAWHIAAALAEQSLTSRVQRGE